MSKKNFVPKGVVDDKAGSVEKKVERKVTVESLELEPLCDEVKDYFATRMISAKTLERNRVMQKRIGDDEIVIAFTYWQKGELVSCKYRNLTKKNYGQERDTRRIFYGLDDIEKASEIIIVEGEFDKLAMEEAGFRNCVSVPDGAPASASKPGPKDITKYKFLSDCNKASRIILATDGDKPGQALAEDVARRLGKERCWLVKWPKKKREDEYFKDANELLISMGPDLLNEAIQNAELYPIEGLFPFKDFFKEIDSYYHRKHYEYGVGVTTGWRNLDKLYCVVPGEVTVVTGTPDSGSEWIDALLCNLNHSFGWKFSVFSMKNNKVRDHARKLLEKHVKKPFFDHHNHQDSVQRMNVEELDEGKQWLNDTFTLIRSDEMTDSSLVNVEWVLERAKAAVVRYGIRGLVIDTYNELLEHQQRQKETEYVCQITKIKRFAQQHSCHVWLVKHPNFDDGAPFFYDNGITIHRNCDDEKAGPNLDLVQVCVRKVRAGHIGNAYLCYDKASGLYSDSSVTPERRLNNRPRWAVQRETL